MLNYPMMKNSYCHFSKVQKVKREQTILRCLKEDNLMKENSFSDWIKSHKKELIIAGVVSIGAVGTVIVIKNWDGIAKLMKSSRNVITKEDYTVIKDAIKTVIPSEILNNLTGNRLTPTELGNKVSCSPQAINKRIINAGLQIKSPCNGYELTETGKLLGHVTWKETAWGYPFSNIEWDEKILEILFSPEELAEIAEKQEMVRKILASTPA